jgi:hypothetical protein
VKRKDVLLRIPTLIIVVVVTTACFTWIRIVCVIKHHAMKTWAGMELHLFLTSALDGDQLHAPAALLPGKESRHPFGRSLDGPRAGLDAVVRRKYPCPCVNRTLVVQTVAQITILTELPRLHEDVSLAN